MIKDRSARLRATSSNQKRKTDTNDCDKACLCRFKLCAKPSLDEGSKDEKHEQKATLQQKPHEKPKKSKETKPTSKKPAVRDCFPNLTEDAGHPGDDQTEKIQAESGDSEEDEGENDGHEDDSFAANDDTGNVPFDPEVKQQKLLKTPLPIGQNPSTYHIDMCIHALHLRIGPWVGVNRGTLKQILQAEGWDFERAIVLWERDLATRKTHHTTNAAGRKYETVLENRFLSAPSLHQNHRMAIDHIYTGLSLKQLSFNPAKRFRLTSLRCALLLIESSWDLEIARGRCMEIVNDLEERERFFRRDRRLRLVIGEEPNQLHKDERVALFMEIAGTDDYTSAEDMVRTHGWDLGVVIDVWMRQGLPLVPYDRKLLRKVFFAAPRFFHTETDCMWPASRPRVPNLSGVDQADRDDHELDYEQGSYVNRKGWIINYDDVLPFVGLVQPEKMRMDMIRSGDFKVLRYHQKPAAKGPKRKAKSTGETVKAAHENFDWNKLHHINKLVSWRRQPPRRISGDLKRSKAKGYHELEDEWIFDWHAAERDRILDGESEEDYRAEGGRWPLKYSTKKLFKEFNELFEGRTDLPATDGEPRHRRTQPALDARRKRIDVVCKTFGLPFCPAHKKDPPEEQTL